MITIDFSGVVLGAVHVELAREQLSEDLIRHYVFNMLSSYKRKFGSEYGNVVICFDDRNYWRKDIFPNYKANRKHTMDEQTIEMFRIIDQIRAEIKVALPWKWMQVDRAEADDLIAWVSTTQPGKHMIISSDQDLNQLINDRVHQYQPIQKGKLKLKKSVDPDFLKMKIICGDSGDGIPNVWSHEDSYVNKVRCKPATEKKIAELASNQDPEVSRRHEQNRQLIDLSCRPEWVTKSIEEAWEKPSTGSMDKLMKLFMEKRMTRMIEILPDFKEIENVTRNTSSGLDRFF